MLPLSFWYAGCLYDAHCVFVTKNVFCILYSVKGVFLRSTHIAIGHYEISSIFELLPEIGADTDFDAEINAN